MDILYITLIIILLGATTYQQFKIIELKSIADDFEVKLKFCKDKSIPKKPQYIPNPEAVSYKKRDNVVTAAITKSPITNVQQIEVGKPNAPQVISKESDTTVVNAGQQKKKSYGGKKKYYHKKNFNPNKSKE